MIHPPTSRPSPLEAPSRSSPSPHPSSSSESPSSSSASPISTTVPLSKPRHFIRLLPAFLSTALLATIARFLSSDTLAFHPSLTKSRSTRSPPISFRSSSPSSPPMCIQQRPQNSIARTNAKTGRTRYHFNTRTFCIFPSLLCVSTFPRASLGSVFYDYFTPTKCARVDTSLIDYDNSPTNLPFSCPSVTNAGLCSYSVEESHKEICLSRKPLTPSPQSSTNVSWIPDNEKNRTLLITVPAFGNLNNIYHFSHVIGHVIHVASSAGILLSTWAHRNSTATDDKGTKTGATNESLIIRHLTILFRGDVPSGYGAWQERLTDLLVKNRLEALGYSVSLVSLFEDRFQTFYPISSTSNMPHTTVTTTAICAHRGIVLGSRNTMAWAFANHQAFENHTLAPSVDSVPVEALLTRVAVLSGLGLYTLTDKSVLEMGVDDLPETLLVDLPPLAVGYSRRNTNRTVDPIKNGGKLIKGRARRFSGPDERWFMSMLHDLADEYEMKVDVLEISHKTSFEKQVEAFKNVGVVTGIHGANLVNAMFMHPFGSMVELSNDETPCYYRGMNAGMSYWHFKPSRIPTVEESYCAEENGKCRSHVRNRRILLENEGDRDRVKGLVREAIERVFYVRRKFEMLGAVPVKLNRERSEYEIDWDWRES